MTFLQSIKTCFRKYFDFKGRATRSEFWWFQLFVIGLTYGAMALDGLLLGSTLDDTVTPLATLAIGILTLPSATVTARRLHDIGWSGWVQLPLFATYTAYLDVWFPQFSLSTLGITLLVGGMLYWLVLCFVLIKDSKPLTNKYGPNPKNPDMGEVFT